MFAKKMGAGIRIMRMKAKLIIVIILLAVPLVAALAVGDEPAGDEGEIIVLKSAEFGSHQWPAVRFDHTLHEEKIDCMVCHHDFQEFGNQDYGDGSKCSTCHKEEGTAKTPINLRTAFHQNCKGCHTRWLEWGRDTGPITCGNCHIRK